MTNLPPDHQLGANNPPDEAALFVERLNGDIEDLLDQMADLELALSKVPKVVEDEEGQAKVTKHVLELRQLARDLETKRVEVKAPYLAREKAIDGLFNGYRDNCLATAKTVEARAIAFLQARQLRLQAEARAEAKRKADEAAAAAAAAAAAKKTLDDAAAARAVAEEALRQTAARQAAPTVNLEAERRLRAATQAEIDASKGLETADKGARQAELAEERAERRVEAPSLSKARGGGGNAAVVMVPRWRLENWGKLFATLGPLSGYLDMKVIEGALDRWAKVAQNKPTERQAMPGVSWYEEPEVKTTPTRTP